MGTKIHAITKNMFTSVTLGLILSVPGLANAAFSFTTIDFPESISTSANGNSTHEIVGDYDDADENTHGFMLNKATFTSIDVPNATFTQINGISANSRITGTYHDGTRFHAFLRDHDVITTLDPLGSSESQGGFLNAQGEVVEATETATECVMPSFGAMVLSPQLTRQTDIQR